MHAGTMVVITLSAALIFALVVFPAMCGIVALKHADTGRLSALFSGRWRAFCGLERAPSQRDVFAQPSGADAALAESE